MTNPIGINNLSQSSNIANATGDEVVSLDKHINTSATDTDQIQAGNDSNLLIVLYVQIMPDDFVGDAANLLI